MVAPHLYNLGVDEFSPAQLEAGTNNAYFYTGSDGAMVFWAPVNGASTSGSQNPRSELRELINRAALASTGSPTARIFSMHSAKCCSGASQPESHYRQIHAFQQRRPAHGEDLLQ